MTTQRRIARVFGTLALAGGTAVAHAGGVVGTGTAASCTPAALVQALNGGGTVTFDCGPDPHTIVLPQRQTIAADTTLAGDGRTTLSGGGTHGLFTVPSGRTLTLDHLTLRDGGTENWAVFVSDDALLRLNGVAVEHCSRGGIYNAGGTVTVSDASFTDNDASTAGAAITNENGGQLTVQRVVFHANLNGAVYSAGPTTITDSLFTDNRGDSAGGGAIVHSRGLQVMRCSFDGNEAVGGGAIYTSGDLVVEESVFRRNRATVFDGGAIQLYNQTQTPSSVTVRASTFAENVAARSGGAVRCDAPSGACTLENVTFSRNAYGQVGGAAELSVRNGIAQMTHATVLAGGSPAIQRIAGTLTLRNSVIADGGCTGGFSDGGGNVQGASGLCAPGFQTGDTALFALQDNGGPTPTHEPGEDSAALGAAATGCLPTDQRGVARPTSACDAGAFQRGAVPALFELNPDHAEVGGPAFTMVVRGASFLGGASPTRVWWNGAPLPTVVVSPTQLVVAVPAELIATVGVATVTVENPDPPVPDGGPSAESLPFTIHAEVPETTTTTTTTPPTTTTTSPLPTTTTSTTLPPAAGPCDGLTSYAAALCDLDQARTPGWFCAVADLDPKLDKAMQSALGKAASLVASARDAAANRRPRLLRRAAAQLSNLARRAGGKRGRNTTPACRTAIVAGTTTLAGRVASLGG